MVNQKKYVEISKMSLGNARGVTRLINNIYYQITEKGRDEVNIIFPKTSYFPPFSMLFLALSIKQMREEFSVDIYFSNYDANWLGYAAHCGFFKLCGMDVGREVGEAKKTDKFIPITFLAVPTKNINIDEVHAEEVERMQKIGEDLARTLLQTDKGDGFLALSYLCREILRNIIEHSFSETMYFAAQHYKNQNKVEVVIADEGEGVIQGINQNPRIELTSDRDALKYAILPGMSGRSHLYSGNSSKHHIYANSGYGLFLTQKICGDAGDFLIISNSHGLIISGSNRYYLPQVSFRGTIVRLTVNLDQVGSIEQKIIGYRLLAEKIIQRTKTLDSISPSAASMMLRL